VYEGRGPKVPPDVWVKVEERMNNIGEQVTVQSRHIRTAVDT
jgi:hypothetical protein